MILSYLVSCLVSQRSRLFRLFAEVTRTLKRALAELLRRRAIPDLRVSNTTYDDHVAKTIKDKAT